MLNVCKYRCGKWLLQGPRPAVTSHVTLSMLRNHALSLTDPWFLTGASLHRTLTLWFPLVSRQVLQFQDSTMPSRKNPSRKNPAAEILTAAMSVAKISRFPLATLKLQLDHYHLPHGGLKKVVAKRLFDHLQSCWESSNDEESESSNEEESDDNSSDAINASSGEEEEDEANTGSDAAAEVDTHSSPTQTPFSDARRQAPQETVRSLMRDEGGHHRRHHTISPPSGEQARPSRKRRAADRHQHTQSRRSKRKRRSPSTSSSVPLPVVAPVHPAIAPLPQTSHRMAGGSIAPAVITIAAESLATPLAVTGAIAMAGARTLTFLFHVSSDMPLNMVSM